MPIWMAAYLAVYITFSLWAFKDDLMRRRLNVLLVLEAVGSISLIFAALPCWYLPMRSFLSRGAASAFAAGLFILFFFAVNKVKATFTDDQLSTAQKVWFAISGVGFLMVVNLPLIWFGAQSLNDYR